MRHPPVTPNKRNNGFIDDEDFVQYSLINFTWSLVSVLKSYVVLLTRSERFTIENFFDKTIR
jgi:hypothetical protein